MTITHFIKLGDLLSNLDGNITYYSGKHDLVRINYSQI